MNATTRTALIALAVVGVYLFGVMTGAVGLPLAQRVAGVVFGGGPERVVMGPGMMFDRDVRGPADGWTRDGAPPAPDCPAWEDGEAGSNEEPGVTPDSRPYGRGMMPPGAWPR